MGTRTEYPNITKAALEISYDNGGINRDRSEAMLVRDLGKYLADFDQDNLSHIDKWLGTLNHDDLVTVCAGEEADALAVLKGAPPFTDSLLTGIFDNVG